MRWILLLVAFLCLAGVDATALHPLAELNEDESGKSPLVAVDPLELEYLKRQSRIAHEYFTVNYEGGAKFFVTYLTNVSSRDAYFLATYEPQVHLIKLSANMSNCIYDVTDNDHFDEIKRSRFVGIGVFWILLFLQCPVGECLEEDIGCQNPPVMDKTKYIKYAAGVLILLLLIIGLIVRRSSNWISDWCNNLLKRRKQFHAHGKGNYQPPAEGH